MSTSTIIDIAEEKEIIRNASKEWTGLTDEEIFDHVLALPKEAAIQILGAASSLDFTITMQDRTDEERADVVAFQEEYLSWYTAKVAERRKQLHVPSGDFLFVASAVRVPGESYPLRVTTFDVDDTEAALALYDDIVRNHEGEDESTWNVAKGRGHAHGIDAAMDFVKQQFGEAMSS